MSGNRTAGDALRRVPNGAGWSGPGWSGVVVWVAAGAVAVVLASTTGVADETTETRVLLVTGEDYPGHKWQETTPVLKTQLEDDSVLYVDVCDTLVKFAETPLEDYAAVVLHFKNYDPRVPGRAAFDRLEHYVASGGGLVLVHFACGAFQEFRNDFESLAGRVWDPMLRGHDPYGEFQVRIVAPEHPVTRGVESFVTTDELYTCLTGNKPIHVLATAESRVDGKTYPIAFVTDAGRGRVFHCVLGHDTGALRNPGASALFRRGTLWAAALGGGRPR